MGFTFSKTSLSVSEFLSSMRKYTTLAAHITACSELEVILVWRWNRSHSQSGTPGKTPENMAALFHITLRELQLRVCSVHQILEDLFLEVGQKWLRSFRGAQGLLMFALREP